MTGPTPPETRRVGVVAIGRNEGERLKACLRSLPADARAVYVDSGSTDDSVAFATARGVRVVALDTTIGFTAARARNAGLAALDTDGPPVEFVQMIDGDCALAPGWIAQATDALDADPGLAAVFGRRRERFPERSVYNRMCDEEWDVPVGPVEACGGDALFRAAPLREAGGYAPDLIAGEEPDLCLRLGRAGWRIRRIDAEMTAHDAAMTRFGQWWRRAMRAGHAFAEHVARHGADAFPGWRRQVRSIAVWGGALPAVALLGLVLAPLSVAFLLLPAAMLLLVAAQVARLALRRRRAGAAPGYAFAGAVFLMLGKLPQMEGMLRYRLGRAAGRRARIIEYKARRA